MRQPYKYKSETFFFLFFLLNLYLLFPGELTPDSQDQYNQALTGNYGLHHPPSLSFLWSILLEFYKHHSTMLICNLALLWGSAYNFYQANRIFDQSKYKFSYLYFILPFTPWLMSYSQFLWKDVFFAYGCLFVASILVRTSLLEENLGFKKIFFILIITFFATSAKYIGAFILPFFMLWLSILIIKNKSYSKIFLTTLIFSGLIFFANIYLEKLLTKNASSISWQAIYLYDLAGISVDQDKMLFPEYILKDKNFSAKMVKENYNTGSSDALVNNNRKDKIYLTNDQNNADELLSYWFQTIIEYPFSFTKHRLSLCKSLITKTNYTPSIKEENSINNMISNYILYCNATTKFIFWIVFLPLYIALGIMARRCLQKDSRGQIMIFMNTVAIVLFLVLLKFSLSSDSRYLLMSLAMITFTHPVAFSCILDLWQKNSNSSTV